MAQISPVPLAGQAGQRLRLRASYAAVTVGILLIIAKLAAWIGTGSVALLSSLVDSLVDVAASLLNLVALHHAAVPADREHRFGHGKAEPLAALGQSAFLCGSALLLIAEAIRRLVTPAHVENAPVGIAVMLFSIALTVALVTYQRHVVRLTGSLAIGADELHYRGDLILNGSVIATLLIGGMFSVPLLDPLFGAAVGVWVIYSAIRIASLSLTQLMDRELPDAERTQVRQIAEGHPEVCAVHDIRTRAAGPTAFIQLHIEMDGGMSLMRAHEISDAVEADLQRAFPHAEIIIHEDPAGIDEAVTFPAPSRPETEPLDSVDSHYAIRPAGSSTEHKGLRSTSFVTPAESGGSEPAPDLIRGQATKRLP
jgi:ferrous-iron efflux pump FieF